MADSRLERHLNSLLEKVISEVRGLLRTNQDLKELEPLLKDYQDALELVGIISNVIDLYFRKVRERLAAPQEEDYRNLQRLLQKNEGQNRQHIRAEQQLKLYSDSLQEKLHESEVAREQLLTSTRDIINNLKRDNQQLSQELSFLREQASRDRVTSRQSNMSDRILQSAKSKRNSSLSGKLRELSNPYEKKKRDSISQIRK